MTKKHITVIRGGVSSEREVSLASGSNVIEALKQTGYHVTDLIADHDIEKTIKFLKKHQPDVVFNALHGQYGEDGAIQGVLEWMKIPYTHSNICASAIAMNKQMTRTLLSEEGLPIATGKVISMHDFATQDPLPYPYVIKPIQEGSSVGVHIIQSDDPKARQNQRQEIVQSWHFGEEALVEEFIPGKELTVCVLEDKALTVTDISAGHHVFYDYQSKYTAGESEHILPARIHPTAFQKALDYAVKAHKTLGCYPASRTDFRYDNTLETEDQPGKLYILEINTQPGMTVTSLLPEQAAFCGMTYPELCAWLAEKAKCHV